MPEPMPACPEWQEPLAAWLVAQLEPAEEGALTAHLATCAACRAEADSLLGVAALTLGADPGVVPWRPLDDEPPPVDLGDRILARVARERRTHRVRRMAVAVVGVAAVTLIGVLATRPGPDPAQPPN
jgi:hypothetical protein